MHFLIWIWHKNVILQGNTLCYVELMLQSYADCC